MDFKRNQVGAVTWCGQEIPVKTDFNSHGQAVSIPRVYIEDMPPVMREGLSYWATEIRAERLETPPVGCGYTLADTKAFLAWVQAKLSAGVHAE